MKSRRAFFYVQHLLGIGHLRRTATFANALAAHGVEVTLASGGLPVPGLRLDRVRFVQLPPAAAADLSFKSLVDAQGAPVDEEWKSKRREILLEAWRAADPQALVVELYPFGRRQMRFELLPLLDAAASAEPRPLVISSVRDVLGGGQKDPSRQDEMLAAFDRHFDRVLVHGDPCVIPFARTFRHSDALAGRLHYTGYIVEGRVTPQSDAHERLLGAEVVVSAGGGAVGRRLLETAIHARGLSALSAARWRLLCGVNVAPADLERLAATARFAGNGGIVVERARADFPRLLEDCAVSVSQAGYNTMMDILKAGARSVVIPFAGGGETEQTVRALAFAEQRLVDVVTEDELTPPALAAAVDRAAARPRPPSGKVDLHGAERSAELLAGWMAERA